MKVFHCQRCGWLDEPYERPYTEDMGAMELRLPVTYIIQSCQNCGSEHLTPIDPGFYDRLKPIDEVA